MGKRLIIVIGGCICTNLFGQTDSLRNEILRHQDSKTIIISKGRKMIFDKFLENDKKKVKEVLDYLVNHEEDEEYLAFYPAEKGLLYYWTEQYDKVINDVIHFDSVFVAHMVRKIRPLQDLFLVKLKEKIREQKMEIISQIETSKFNETDKEFLKLNFESLLTDDQDQDITQDYLNKSADQFLLYHAKSKYEGYIRKFIRYEIKPSEWGLGFEFFSGYGVFTGNLQKNFKNNVPIGVAFDILYKNFALYLRDYIGFSRTNDSIAFPSGTWEKNAQVRVFLPEASIGYVALDNKLLKIAPFIGIASTDVSPTENDRIKIPQYKNIGLKFTATYTIGLNVDFKLAKSRIQMVAAREESYWFLKIRYAYNKPQFDWKYNGFSGDFHYVTIGIGGFGRKAKRDY